MRYTVTWDDDAIDDLADIWLKSADPRAITSAAESIDRILATEPGTKGRKVSEGLRSLNVFPLRVFFEVRDADRLAKVLRVIQSPDLLH